MSLVVAVARTGSRCRAVLHLLARPRLRVSVLADEPDNRVLECAVAGKADIIVTGDKALRALETYRGIGIVSLREYLDR